MPELTMDHFSGQYGCGCAAFYAAARYETKRKAAMLEAAAPKAQRQPGAGAHPGM